LPRPKTRSAAAKRDSSSPATKGRFSKDCPGTRHYTCCGYRDPAHRQLLHHGLRLLHPAGLFPPAGAAVLRQSRRAVSANWSCLRAPGIQRIGTGEFTDSLIWEPWTELSHTLALRFARQQRAVLELKTKTVNIDGLLTLAHRSKTILAWSLNTERVIRSDERGTASLDARLRAAARCAQAGYPIAFHFDPVVIYAGGEEEYRQVVDRLFAAVPTEQIVWISLGAFRFMPDLKSLIQRRFPKSKIVYGEFIAGLDGKARYFKPLRMQALRSLARAIQQRAPKTCLYLCMEDDEVWRHALGFTPAERGGLSRMLDEAAIKHCGLEGGP
jgi:spore photoproduct lyase